jgi:phosphonate transport system substrate-binding protein
MASESGLVLGVFPRQNAKISYALFRPLAQYLESELGRSITLDVSTDSSAFWRKLSAGKFDIIYCNQYHYLAAHKAFNFEVIGTSVEFGQPTIAGAIVVRKDSGFDSLTDLKGKTILFGGGSRAMQSYIVATALLRSGGLTTSDYREEYAINSPNAVLAVYYQQVDAAGSGDLILQLPAVRERIDISQLKYLAIGEQLPQLPWAVSRTLPPKLRLLIRSVLIGMEQTEEGRKVLKSTGLDRIAPAKDSDFDSFRKIILEIKGEQY